jgi:hypothetical protein
VRFCNLRAPASHLQRRHASFLLYPYLFFSFRKVRKANFITRISPALIRKNHQCEFHIPFPTKALAEPPLRPLWEPVEIINLLLTYSRVHRILLGLWMCLSARQGGQAL